MDETPKGIVLVDGNIVSGMEFCGNTALCRDRTGGDFLPAADQERLELTTTNNEILSIPMEGFAQAISVSS